MNNASTTANGFSPSANDENTTSESVFRTDTLPGQTGVDLSLASSVIPVELFARIMGHIAQIDRSLFGMSSHLDFSGA
ncbi:MAG TPA: hypothetical protein VFV28_00960, partial [Limnobacter sp.]|nr:hypothetical protein [Limnobacter sp.]